jgi:hypothetical protein
MQYITNSILYYAIACVHLIQAVGTPEGVVDCVIAVLYVQLAIRAAKAPH